MSEEKKTLYQILSVLNIPCCYSHFTDKDAPKAPPYIVYIGQGQDTFSADNTWYHRENNYQIEYYFKTKDEDMEASIEQHLLDNGFLYEKSEDVYIEDEGVFVIYYTI